MCDKVLANGWLIGKNVTGKQPLKKPVKNKDLWQRLDEATQQHKIDWKWVKGHSGHIENDRVDALANKAMDEKGGNE